MQPSSSLWAGAYRRLTWALANERWYVRLLPPQLTQLCLDTAWFFPNKDSLTRTLHGHISCPSQIMRLPYCSIT